MNGNNPMNNDERVNEGTAMVQTMDTRPEENTEWQQPSGNPQTVESEQLSLLKGEEIKDLHTRWDSIQAGFVDNPRTSVEQAHALMGEAFERVEQAFSHQRGGLENRWKNNGNGVSTEDLRLVLQGYRSFLNRLLEL